MGLESRFAEKKMTLYFHEYGGERLVYKQPGDKLKISATLQLDHDQLHVYRYGSSQAIERRCFTLRYFLTGNAVPIMKLVPVR